MAPFDVARAELARYHAAGVRVFLDAEPIGEHVTEMIAGFPGALNFLQDRFDGLPAPDNMS